MLGFLAKLISSIVKFGDRQKALRKAVAHRKTFTQKSREFNMSQLRRDKKKLLDLKENRKKEKIQEQAVRAGKYIVLFMFTLLMQMIDLLIGVIFMLITSLKFVILMVAVAVIVAVVIVLEPLGEFGGLTLDDDLPKQVDFDLGRPTSGIHRSNLQWTEEELNQYGIELTDYEKNLFRAVILAKEATLPKWGIIPEVANTSNANTPWKMALGLTSIESSMRFYKDGENFNIFKVPTNSDVNTAGYGFMGLNPETTRFNTAGNLTADMVTHFTNTYIPSTAPAYDAFFIPKAVGISVDVQMEKMKGIIRSSSWGDVVDEIATAYGIVANKEDFKEKVLWFATHSQYHGAVYVEYKGYISFWGALYAMSSPDDSTRSFDNWSLGNAKGTPDYSESGYRRLILGDRGGMLPSTSDFHNLPMPTTSNQILLNGQPIAKPLWSLVYDKYSGNVDAFDAASTLLTSFITNNEAKGGFNGGGVGSRILNFHYGFNSLLQANNVMTTLSSKLAINLYYETPGEAQGVYNGGTLLDYLAQKNYKLSEAMHFKNYWGIAKFIEPQVINGVAWAPDKWGVPFYAQSKTLEDYAQVEWAPYDTGGDNTFARNGCMVYAFSYTFSALQGRLINPPEAASVMWATNTLVSGGLSYSNLPELASVMGFKYSEYELSIGISRPTAANFTEGWKRIDSTLANGGLVVARGNKPLANGTNHFVVFTDRKVVNGVPFYSIYSSSKIYHTVDWWQTRAEYETALHNRLYFFLKK